MLLLYNITRFVNLILNRLHFRRTTQDDKVLAPLPCISINVNILCTSQKTYIKM